MTMEDEQVAAGDAVLSREAILFHVELVKRQLIRLTNLMREEDPLPRRQVRAMQEAQRALAEYEPSPTLFCEPEPGTNHTNHMECT